MLEDVSIHERAAASRRWRLKQATQAAHERVEALVGRAGMFASDEGYLRYLQATYRAREGVERQLEAAGAAALSPDWERRRLSQALSDDIRDLGGDLPADALSQPAIGSRAELLGALYVLEGSALGARLLVKSAEALGYTARSGARHLHQQAGDGQAWRSFLALLAAEDMDEAQETACAAAANATFEAFALAYEEWTA
jgi:heme oxygenase